MKTPRKLSSRTVIGISLIVVGAAVLGVATWNMTVGDQIARNQQQLDAQSIPLAAPESVAGSIDGTQLEVGEVFAKLNAPRFGQDYVRNIAEGTSLSKVLNTVGIGHYSNTAMPGEIGNFAIAGHRSGNGGPMRDIDKFVPGDLVTVETSTATFTYKYLETTIVKPSQVGVIAPVPVGLSAAKAGGKYLTMTSCTPIGVNTDRIIVWFELVEN